MRVYNCLQSAYRAMIDRLMRSEIDESNTTCGVITEIACYGDYILLLNI